MPANAACALAATLESFGAKPSAPPPAPELIAAKRSCSNCDKSPVKFATDRSASANTVGSSTATCVIVLLPTVETHKRRAAGIDDCGPAAGCIDGEQPVAAGEIDHLTGPSHLNCADDASADNVGQDRIAARRRNADA